MTRTVFVLVILCLGAVSTRHSARAGEGGLGISPDGKTVAAAEDHAIDLIDVTSGNTLRRVANAHNNVRAVAFSPDGRMLASCGDDDTVRLWDAATTKEVRRIPATRVVPAEGRGDHVVDIGDPLNTVAFSPDGRLIAAAGHGGHSMVRLWEVATGRESIRLDGARDAVYSVAFSADGRCLAAGSFDGDVHVWNITTRRETHRLPCGGRSVYSVAFSPDGQILASAGADGAVRLWNPTTGEEVRRLRGADRSWLFALAFSPDGRLLASGGNDKAVRVWETASGRELRRLGVNSGDVWSLGFTLGGLRVIARSARGNQTEVQWWDLGRAR